VTRLGFLFNHDAAHQVMHAAPVAFEMAQRYPGVDVRVLVTSEGEADAVADLARSYPQSPLQVERVEPSPLARRLDRVTGNAFLLKRIGVLRRYRRVFADFDMLVVPDKTSLFLKRWLGTDCPLLGYICHGAGDRAGSLRGDESFDFCLLPGRKYEARIREGGRLPAERYAVVGYPKLDIYRTAPRPRLFEGDKPVILYTPHFHPGLSSWFDWGRQILEYFEANPSFNLIFAPHVLLFRRRWHISTQGGLPRRTPPVPPAIGRAPNIQVDLGSRASIDMTYLRAADIYLGDVSSQVYEFIYRPRPCLFLNAGGADWSGNPHFRLWKLGDVVDSPDDLPDVLDRAVAEPNRYRVEQERAFAEAFDLTEQPSAARAAEALAAYLRREGRLSDSGAHLLTGSTG